MEVHDLIKVLYTVICRWNSSISGNYSG